MPDFPTTPTPSSISTPALIDPVLRKGTDALYEYRRPLASRTRRRYALEWLGKTTEELRTISDFVYTVRGGALTFTWIHTTAADFVTVLNTTPVILQFQHAMVTGQWLWVGTFSPGIILPVGVYRVTRINATQVSLDGTSASGGGTCYVRTYLPTAVLVLAGDVYESPVKLIGPDQLATYARWNLQCVIEEIF